MESKHGPLNPQTEQIDINSILAEGIIKTKGDNRYFVVSKVFIRGRSAPHVLNEQILDLKSISPASTPLNTSVKGLLTCEAPHAKSNRMWEFKLTQ